MKEPVSLKAERGTLDSLNAVFDCNNDDFYCWATCYYCWTGHKSLLLV